MIRADKNVPWWLIFFSVSMATNSASHSLFIAWETKMSNFFSIIYKFIIWTNSSVTSWKETRNSFKKLPSNLFMDFKQNHCGSWGSITKTATFKSFLHLSFKTQLLFLWQCFLICSWGKQLMISGVTQKHELRVFFNTVFAFFNQSESFNFLRF